MSKPLMRYRPYTDSLDHPVASTRVQGWGDEPCEPTVRLPVWSELVASYSRMKSAWGWANGGQPILVCYIRKYVIILTSPNQNIGGCVPGIPGGVDASVATSCSQKSVTGWQHQAGCIAATGPPALLVIAERSKLDVIRWTRNTRGHWAVVNSLACSRYIHWSRTVCLLLVNCESQRSQAITVKCCVFSNFLKLWLTRIRHNVRQFS